MTKRIDDKTARDLMLANNLIPLVPYPGAMTPWLSTCVTCGLEVTPTYSNVRTGHRGCKYCSGNSISEARIAAILSDKQLEPLVPYPGASVGWLCTCKVCGKQVSPHFSSLVQGQGGCIYCAGRRIDALEAKSLMRAAGFKTLIDYPGANRSWESLCTQCGEITAPTLSDVKRGVGCKFCGGKVVKPEVADARARQLELEPLEPYPGYSHPWKCRCLRCGSEVQPSYHSLKINHGGCKYCAGIAIKSEDAVQLMVNAEVTPLEPYPGAMSPWICACNKCGRRVSPTYTHVRISGNGCKYCTPLGFGFDEPAIVYLITNEELNAHKVGIAGINTSRVKDHQRNGWVVYKSLNVPTGDEAYEIEQEMLRWLREDMGLGPYLLKEQMPQSGHTETFSAEDIDLVTVWDQLLEVASLSKDSVDGRS